MGRSVFMLISLLAIITFSGCTNGQESNPDLTSNSNSPEIENIIPDGTTIGNLDLSGVAVQKGKEKLEKWVKEKLAESLFIVYNGTEIEIIPQKIGIGVHVEKTWEGIINNPGQKSKVISKSDENKVKKKLEEILSPYTSLPVDAKFKVEKDQFIITPSENGHTFDMDKLLVDINEVLLNNPPRKVEVTKVDVLPKVTTEDLQAQSFDTIIGEFTTQYNPSDKNRSKNLEIAVSKIDNKLLKPGETISFNQIVGPRTAETGFKDAYIVIRNKYVKGMGGGICQVSSTLYNAALLANMTVVERHPHAVVVSYVPLGQDATINYPNLDLKLRNDSPGYLYIRAKAEKGKLTVSIYGKETGTKVRIERQVEKEIPFETLREINHNLLPGAVVQEQAGYKGYVVKTWKIITDAQGKESKSQLNYDRYAPTPRILSIGAD